METFTKLFATWLVFIYHCFDRIVLSGYPMGLQRPGQVVYWLQQVLGVNAITKDVLARRTKQYVAWVESYARNRRIPLQWAEKNIRKEGYVLPRLRRAESENRYGVYFIFQANRAGLTGPATNSSRALPVVLPTTPASTSTAPATVSIISTCAMKSSDP